MEIKASETSASRVALSATSKPRPRAFSAVRFQTFTSCPSPPRRCAIAAPILPVPAMPIFMTRYLLVPFSCVDVDILGSPRRQRINKRNATGACGSTDRPRRRGHARARLPGRCSGGGGAMRRALCPVPLWSWRWGDPIRWEPVVTVSDVTTSRVRGSEQTNSYADHLDTPRVVADAAGATVWRWDHQETFGVNEADENPSAMGAFRLTATTTGTGPRAGDDYPLHHDTGLPSRTWTFISCTLPPGLTPVAAQVQIARLGGDGHGLAQERAPRRHAHRLGRPDRHGRRAGAARRPVSPGRNRSARSTSPSSMTIGTSQSMRMPSRSSLLGESMPVSS